MHLVTYLECSYDTPCGNTIPCPSTYKYYHIVLNIQLLLISLCVHTTCAFFLLAIFTFIRTCFVVFSVKIVKIEGSSFYFTCRLYSYFYNYFIVINLFVFWQKNLKVKILQFIIKPHTLWLYLFAILDTVVVFLFVNWLIIRSNNARCWLTRYLIFNWLFVLLKLFQFEIFYYYYIDFSDQSTVLLMFLCCTCSSSV